MTTCKVEAKVYVDDVTVKSRTWLVVDVMDTSRTRAWTTRQFNTVLKDLNSCLIGKDKIIRAVWTADYGKAQGYTRLSGWLSGVNGKVMARRGIFER